jgi:hypothetical protein
VQKESEFVAPSGVSSSSPRSASASSAHLPADEQVKQVKSEDLFQKVLFMSDSYNWTSLAVALLF